MINENAQIRSKKNVWVKHPACIETNLIHCSLIYFTSGGQAEWTKIRVDVNKERALNSHHRRIHRRCGTVQVEMILYEPSYPHVFRTARPNNSGSAKYLNPLLATAAKLRKSSRSDFPRRTRRPTLTTADGAAGCGLPLARQPPTPEKAH